MNELDKVLQSVRPQEPSSGYLDRGLARIAAFPAPSNLVSPGWRYATIGLALLFCASFVLNVTNWIEERREAASEATLVFSVLRQEGDLMIRETRYEHPGTPETTNE